MTTAQIREAFLIDALFRPGEIHQVHVDLDRAVVGMAVPLRSPIGLTADETLRAKYFTERRELGVLNIATDGVIHVGSESYLLGGLDCLYIGQGTKEITFESTNQDSPAVFYLLSYPAHCSYPTTLVRKTDASLVELGSAEMCNRRTICKYIGDGRHASALGKRVEHNASSRPHAPIRDLHVFQFARASARLSPYGVCGRDPARCY
jgi:4-deoxy-L-threo-5-hexosulose-uronate ketol-isomerase